MSEAIDRVGTKPRGNHHAPPLAHYVGWSESWLLMDLSTVIAGMGTMPLSQRTTSKRGRYASFSCHV